MSTVQAFNTMLKNFMEELASVFPEETQIAVFVGTFDTLVALDDRKLCEMFVQALAPHAQLAMAKDPALFDQIEFPGGIDFKRLWNSDDLSDNTRQAIWEYINMLLLLGTAVQSMPAEMLESIETVAKTCADKMQNGQLDFSSLGSMLMNGGGMGGLGGLIGGLDMLGDDGESEAALEAPPARRPMPAAPGGGRPRHRAPTKRPARK